MMELSIYDPECTKWRPIDASTGEMIKGVWWANDDTGEYAAYLYDEQGQPIIDEVGVHGAVLQTIRWELFQNCNLELARVKG